MHSKRERLIARRDRERVNRSASLFRYYGTPVRAIRTSKTRATNMVAPTLVPHVWRNSQMRGQVRAKVTYVTQGTDSRAHPVVTPTAPVFFAHETHPRAKNSTQLPLVLFNTVVAVENPGAR